jgi:GGDEF domain-containing protein
MDVRINDFDAFKEVYGFVAGDDVLRFTSMLMNEIMDELGTSNDFIGHAGGDNFIIITTEAAAPAIRKQLKARFAEEVLTHYSFIDRDQGYIVATDENGNMVKEELMSLSIGTVTPSQYQFADIREITELAAEARRADLL